MNVVPLPWIKPLFNGIYEWELKSEPREPCDEERAFMAHQRRMVERRNRALNMMFDAIPKPWPSELCELDVYDSYTNTDADGERVRPMSAAAFGRRWGRSRSFVERVLRDVLP